MSVMLGSSRRDTRERIRIDGSEVSLERPGGSLMTLIGRLLTLLGTLFGPPEPRA